MNKKAVVAGAALLSFVVLSQLKAAGQPIAPPATLTINFIQYIGGSGPYFTLVSGYVSPWKDWTVMVCGPTKGTIAWDGPSKCVYITSSMYDSLRSRFG